MGNWFKNCCGYSFKTKETRDASDHSNESPRSRDFIRASFSQSQYREDTTAPRPSELSDHSSPTGSRRLETSPSHDTELADRLQRLLAERQRQEISSADFRSSQQKVRLKNGSEVLAGDIPPIMNSLRKMKKQHQEIMEEMKITSFLAAYGITDAYRENSNQNRVGRMVDLELALYDLEQKCSNPNYQLSSNSQKVLEEYKLINMGEPSDSVKNIVLSSSQSNSGDGSPVAADRVKLKNGADEDPTLVKTVMSLLRDLRAKKPEALSELHKLCQDQNYTLDNDTTGVLKSKSFINQDTGKPYKAVENIVLSSFDEKPGKLCSPAMPLDELEKWVQKIMKEKLVNLAKEMKGLTNTEIFFSENIDIKEKVEKLLGVKTISQQIKQNELNIL